MWASGPLLDMYANRRRLRVGRVIGPEWKPTGGIPAGCPIAVFALAVCTKPWAALVDAQENITRRLYVDDSTAWASGPVDVVVETIAKAVSNTRLFEAAFGWQLHPQKSVVGCTNPKGINRLAAESGLPAATRIKDLCAIHEVGGARSNPATTRAKASLSRWMRISKLYLNPKCRRQLASAAATPAATYGSALGRHPQRQWSPYVGGLLQKLAMGALTGRRPRLHYA